jgi:hypothetical protein
MCQVQGVRCQGMRSGSAAQKQELPKADIEPPKIYVPTRNVYENTQS